jgi:hypothetical protein
MKHSKAGWILKVFFSVCLWGQSRLSSLEQANSGQLNESSGIVEAACVRGYSTQALWSCFPASSLEGFSNGALADQRSPCTVVENELKIKYWSGLIIWGRYLHLGQPFTLITERLYRKLHMVYVWWKNWIVLSKATGLEVNTCRVDHS